MHEHHKGLTHQEQSDNALAPATDQPSPTPQSNIDYPTTARQLHQAILGMNHTAFPNIHPVNIPVAMNKVMDFLTMGCSLSKIREAWTPKLKQTVQLEHLGYVNTSQVLEIDKELKHTAPGTEWGIQEWRLTLEECIKYAQEMMECLYGFDGSNATAISCHQSALGVSDAPKHKLALPMGVPDELIARYTQHDSGDSHNDLRDESHKDTRSRIKKVHENIRDKPDAVLGITEGSWLYLRTLLHGLSKAISDKLVSRCDGKRLEERSRHEAYLGISRLHSHAMLSGWAPSKESPHPHPLWWRIAALKKQALRPENYWHQNCLRKLLDDLNTELGGSFILWQGSNEAKLCTLLSHITKLLDTNLIQRKR